MPSHPSGFEPVPMILLGSSLVEYSWVGREGTMLFCLLEYTGEPSNIFVGFVPLCQL
jgi:hypothetical protein